MTHASLADLVSRALEVFNLRLDLRWRIGLEIYNPRIIFLTVSRKVLASDRVLTHVFINLHDQFVAHRLGSGDRAGATGLLPRPVQ